MEHFPNNPSGNASRQWSWVSSSGKQRYPLNWAIDHGELRDFFRHISRCFGQLPRQGCLDKNMDVETITAHKALQDFLIMSLFERPLAANGIGEKAYRDQLSAAAFLLGVTANTFSIPSHGLIYDSFQPQDLELRHLRMTTLGFGELSATEGFIGYLSERPELINPLFKFPSIRPDLDKKVIDKTVLNMKHTDIDSLIQRYFQDRLVGIIEKMVEKRVVKNVPEATLKMVFSGPKKSTSSYIFRPNSRLTAVELN